MIENIRWLGHDSFKITNDKIVYIDPWQLKGGEKADVILITHEHFDHFSKEDIDKIRKPETVIVTTEAVASQLTGNVKPVKPGDKVNVEGIEIEAVPAYNTNKYRDEATKQVFHPKADQKVGFVITIGGERIYHAGDTDVIQEMGNLGNIDVALIPVSGTYVMTADEAVQAADTIKPKMAIPMHFGTIVGSREDAEKFKKEAKVPVTILEPEK